MSAGRDLGAGDGGDGAGDGASETKKRKRKRSGQRQATHNYRDAAKRAAAAASEVRHAGSG